MWKDSANEQQRLGQLMPRYAPDDPVLPEQQTAWETVAGIIVAPRRSPWKTAGQDDDSLLAQVSDDYVPATRSNIIITQGGGDTGGKVNIEVLTGLSVVNNSLVATYATYAFDAYVVSTRTATVLPGTTCS